MSFSIDEPEKKLLTELEHWLDKRRYKYVERWNFNQDDLVNEAKLAEDVAILSKIDKLRREFRIK